MRFLAVEKLSEHKYKTPEGYLVCVDAILSRTGKQEYMRSELFGDSCDNADEIINVDRLADDVFDEKALASFENKPICLEHPSEDVNVANHNELSVGFVRDIKRGTINGQDVMLGTLVVTDENAIQAIESGEYTELSCGYDCDIVDSEHPCQKNIRGNHVALCKHGRAGIAKIVDSANNSIAHTHTLRDDTLSNEDYMLVSKWVIELLKKNDKAFDEYERMIMQIDEIDENEYKMRYSSIGRRASALIEEFANNAWIAQAKKHFHIDAKGADMKDANYEQWTKQGYRVVALYKDGGRIHAIVERKSGDFVVALGYDTSTGEWAQGRYVSTFGAAVDTLNEEKPNATPIRDAHFMGQHQPFEVWLSYPKTNRRFMVAAFKTHEDARRNVESLRKEWTNEKDGVPNAEIRENAHDSTNDAKRTTWLVTYKSGDNFPSVVVVAEGKDDAIAKAKAKGATDIVEANEIDPERAKALGLDSQEKTFTEEEKQTLYKRWCEYQQRHSKPVPQYAYSAYTNEIYAAWENAMKDSVKDASTDAYVIRYVYSDETDTGSTTRHERVVVKANSSAAAIDKAIAYAKRNGTYSEGWGRSAFEIEKSINFDEWKKAYPSSNYTVLSDSLKSFEASHEKDDANFDRHATNACKDVDSASKVIDAKSRYTVTGTTNGVYQEWVIAASSSSEAVEKAKKSIANFELTYVSSVPTKLSSEELRYYRSRPYGHLVDSIENSQKSFEVSYEKDGIKYVRKVKADSIVDAIAKAQK